MSIKEKYSRYKIVHWLTLAIGIVLCGIQIWRYTHNQFESLTTELFVSIVWVVLILSPKTLVDLIKERYSNDTKGKE